MIDNVEYLNEHSSNALLKVLEESNNRTYFFIIHDASCKILNTIKSRCFEFRIFFSINEKKRILENLNMQYGNFFNSNDFNEILQFDSPGNILKYFFLLKNSGINFSRNKLEAIIYLIENYKNKNFVEISNFISFLIELYYNDLSLRNLEKLNYYSHNRFKLLKLINNTKFFNLDKKNLFTSIIGTLENESK